MFILIMKYHNSIHILKEISSYQVIKFLIKEIELKIGTELQLE